VQTISRWRVFAFLKGSMVLYVLLVYIIQFSKLALMKDAGKRRKDQVEQKKTIMFIFQNRISFLALYNRLNVGMQ